ncbi:SusD/RagB family nutrient-binding outer membrane lipoprotein [Marinoscillum sp. 108]|uniref:SusD/RagB family nutrient-binding outer membrane lipoprotein n=1 Tax=Marinoscillum sp. 108 TaxID=2653151 RepID=UPI0012F2EF1D|nr:SusD/RagB family nutrient-binding outer membrane lipoprotein [Marinoscillum sp. 108]VXD18106.1 SusD/RagB family nutrient-binding outer membrane lipoprotein [Marinoscillum sp. 108]
MKNLLYIVLTTVAVAFTGCTSDFEDINTDKNKVAKESYVPGYHLSRAQLEYTGNSDFSYDTWRINIIYSSMMTQQLANASWYAGDKYMQNDGWANASFDVAYNDQVKYIVDLLKITETDPLYANLHQIARIMKVIIFHRLTDLYGEIPYSEAGLAYHEGIYAPKYDTQEFIYMDMLKELKEAAEALNANGDLPGSGDLIYGSAADPIGQWKKLAYSMMLRLSMRLTEVAPTVAKQWAETAVNGGVFTSNADNAFIMHDAAGGRTTVNRNSNILAGEWNATNTGEVFLSKTFVDFLSDTNDPRLGLFARIQSTGDTDPANQIGLPNGLDQNGGAFDVSTDPDFPGDITNYSTIRDDVFLSLSGPTFVINYAQVELLLAEAALRNYSVGGTAESHYTAGVTAAMQFLTQYNSTAEVPADEITTYLAANPFVVADGMEMIGAQYWVASFLDWYEVWSNWRRTGYPELVPVDYPGNATGGVIPRRMIYPSHEASNNSVNYAEAISRQGTNTFLTKVWWDAR